jgi:hypothetical protein
MPLVRFLDMERDNLPLNIICSNTPLCEAWSLTLREKCRLKVFENRVLRGIFGAERDEVTG